MHSVNFADSENGASTKGLGVQHKCNMSILLHLCCRTSCATLQHECNTPFRVLPMLHVACCTSPLKTAFSRSMLQVMLQGVMLQWERVKDCVKDYVGNEHAKNARIEMHNVVGAA